MRRSCSDCDKPIVCGGLDECYRDGRCLGLRAANEAKTKPTVLEEADELVSGARAQGYGPPDVNLGRIADIWTVLLKTPITPAQVCLCMVGLKLAREVHSHKRDNLVDAAGYLRLIERLTEVKQPDPETDVHPFVPDKFGTVYLPQLMARLFCTTVSEAKRNIEAGAVRVDGAITEYVNWRGAELHNKTLQLGRRRFRKLVLAEAVPEHRPCAQYGEDCWCGTPGRRRRCQRDNPTPPPAKGFGHPW